MWFSFCIFIWLYLSTSACSTTHSHPVEKEVTVGFSVFLFCSCARCVFCNIRCFYQSTVPYLMLNPSTNWPREMIMMQNTCKFQFPHMLITQGQMQWPRYTCSQESCEVGVYEHHPATPPRWRKQVRLDWSSTNVTFYLASTSPSYYYVNTQATYSIIMIKYITSQHK